MKNPSNGESNENGREFCLGGKAWVVGGGLGESQKKIKMKAPFSIIFEGGVWGGEIHKPGVIFVLKKKKREKKMPHFPSLSCIGPTNMKGKKKKEQKKVGERI